MKSDELRKIAVYPGSFDPVTNGHLDIIARAARLVDKLYVAVLTNTSKRPTFSIEERISLIKTATSDIANVEVDFFHGLLVDYLQSKNAGIIIKGLRALSDFEYEFQMALTNHQLCPDAETVFLTASAKYMFLSSNIVREVGRWNGDISDFVPEAIHEQIKSRLTKEGLQK